MKIIVAGGTGFIGKPLIAALVGSGHQVVQLTRKGEGTSSVRNPLLVRWDGTVSGDWIRYVDGADAVVNLAGESIAGKRWTAGRKEILRSSRVIPTRSIVSAIRQSARRPSVLVNASGVGYYGDVPTEEVAEDFPKGRGFLSNLCEEWEGEAWKAGEFGVRVVALRTGVVLGKNGGALEKMLLPFKLFAGGPLGSGKQWFPWIHIEDQIGLVEFALGNGAVSGPLNCAAPEPAMMAEFCTALGRAMRRPSWAPVPEFALKLILGELSEVILTGQRIVPAKSLRAGFSFRHTSLEGALSNLFGA